MAKVFGNEVIRTQLAILQYNVQHNRFIMNQLFRDSSIKNQDIIIIIQEPYYNKHNGGTHNPAHAKDNFQLIYSPSKN